MNRILKGFTLVELIIVMAILTVLMAAIMHMFKPIRETFVDSTLYENQRTAQNGIITYVTESLRYATDLGVYNKSNISDAVDEFAKAYCKKNTSADKDTVKKNAEVIVIDNTQEAYSFNGADCTGRVLRRKNVGDSSLNETLGSGCRLVLGSAYYGENDYFIKLSKPPEILDGLTDPADIAAEQADWSADEGIRITVASTASYGQRQLQRSESFVENGKFNDKLISTEGLVVCPNLSKLGGLFDVQKDAPAGGGGGGGENPGPTPAPGPGQPGVGSSNDDAVYVNGHLSDDTVTDPDADPDNTPDPDDPSSYVDNSEYDSDLAIVPGSKVYIVFLTN